ncbi:hypothetical protein [Paracoccus beibuensis]|uniref:hypothetical protein n=1 Tax=Paracoccus beibuensis TaxID=547602 RepID=UPI00223F5364|nr:hypothetical protein [Paracoccus beibuensis]
MMVDSRPDLREQKHIVCAARTRSTSAPSCRTMPTKEYHEKPDAHGIDDGFIQCREIGGAGRSTNERFG